MKSAQKKQLAWWASKIYEQGNFHADTLDPKRTGKIEAARLLDTMVITANKLHILLTGKVIPTQGD